MPASKMQKNDGIEADFEVLRRGILIDKQELFDRISSRINKMFEQGLIDEVKILMDKGVLKSQTASSSIGYKEVIDFIQQGKTDIEILKKEIEKHTRSLVKRQLTWLKRDAKIQWISFA